ncbi:hypothetical protein FRC07_012936, partial [Ceratobasidium sp. 392]
MPNSDSIDDLPISAEERTFVQRLLAHKPALTAEEWYAAFIPSIFYTEAQHSFSVKVSRLAGSRQFSLFGLIRDKSRCLEDDVILKMGAWPKRRQLREAHEEVGLAYDHPDIHILATLTPFISQFRLLVTPVIAWATSSAFLRDLKANEGEVDAIWDHPLEAVLSPEFVYQPGIVSEPLAEKGTEGWPYESDVYEPYDRDWMRGTHYRMHRFRSVAVPVKGLTADIL